MTWGGTSALFLHQPHSLDQNNKRHIGTSIHTFKMVLPKSKKSVGLGNSLMNDRFGKSKNSEMHRGNYQQQGIERTGQNGEKVPYIPDSLTI